MSARKIRAKWLEWRRSGIGGSDAPIVAGVSPWGTRMEVFLSKRGRLPERAPTEAMSWGLRLEPAIAEAYQERTGEEFGCIQKRLRSEAYPFMISTLDRVTKSGRVVELKAAGIGTGSRLGDEGDAGSLPDHWIVQAQHQMLVAGVNSVTFAVLMPALELRVYEVAANRAIQDSLTTVEEAFWDQVQRDEPPADLRPSDAKTIASAFRGCEGYRILGATEAEAADQYVRLGLKIRELERDRECARAQLLLSLGDSAAGELPDGRIVNRKVIDIPERVVRAGRQVRLSIKDS